MSQLRRKLDSATTRQCLSQGYYASAYWTANTSVNRTSILSPGSLLLDVGGATEELTSALSLDCNSDSAWDANKNITAWAAGHAYAVGDWVRPVSATLADGSKNNSTARATVDTVYNRYNTGIILSATEELNTSYDINNAFDSDMSSFWYCKDAIATLPLNIAVNFQYGNGIVINKYKISPGVNGKSTAWLLQGSNDSTSLVGDATNSNKWTTLDTISNFTPPDWGVYTSYFTINNSISYFKYRLCITASTSNYYLGLASLYFVSQPRLVYKCTTAGTSLGTEPSWGVTVGGTTTESAGLVWTAYYDDTYALNRAGTDFFIYACQPTSGTTPVMLLSRNSTYPHGYTANNSRKIGGFHCLCNSMSVPTTWVTSTAYVLGSTVIPPTPNGYWYRCVSAHSSASEPTWPTTIDSLDSGSKWICEPIHSLSGYVTGDILPQSVWGLNFKSISTNNGMVYDPSINRWVGIYLQSGTSTTTASAYNATITDTRMWNDHVDDAAVVKCLLPNDMQFQAFAAGSNEMTNIMNSADPVVTGGYVDTSGRRMVSNIGCESCCGSQWQRLSDQSYQAGSGGAGWKNVVGGTKGQLYLMATEADVKLDAGGNWNSGSFSGSRSREAVYHRWYTGTAVGARFISKAIVK